MVSASAIARMGRSRLIASILHILSLRLAWWARTRAAGRATARSTSRRSRSLAVMGRELSWPPAGEPLMSTVEAAPRSTSRTGWQAGIRGWVQASWLPIALVAGLTAVGFAIRVANVLLSLFGDELSTYWIVHGHSLGDVLSSVRSNDEITPPLYFVLGWLSLHLGSGPAWIRLPSLLAGTVTIPLIYLLGLRTVGR